MDKKIVNQGIYIQISESMYYSFEQNTDIDIITIINKL